MWILHKCAIIKNRHPGNWHNFRIEMMSPHPTPEDIFFWIILHTRKNRILVHQDLYTNIAQKWSPPTPHPKTNNFAEIDFFCLLCITNYFLFLQKKRYVRHKLVFGQSQKCRFEKSNNPGNRCLKKWSILTNDHFIRSNLTQIFFSGVGN